MSYTDNAQAEMNAIRTWVLGLGSLAELSDGDDAGLRRQICERIFKRMTIMYNLDSDEETEVRSELREYLT